MFLKALSIALLIGGGETAYPCQSQPNQGGVHVPQPLPYYPIKPPTTNNQHPADYPEVKPVGHSRRPQQPIHGLPSECYRDDHRGQQVSIEDINPYHDIGRARDEEESEDDDESRRCLETHDWLPPPFRFPGELRSAAFAFPVYVWTVTVKVAEVIADVPYTAIQAIRYRQGVNTPSPGDYVQVILKHPAQIIHVNVKPETIIKAHEELFSYVPILRDAIDFRQYKRVEQEKENNPELPGIEWQEAGEVVVKATEN